MLSLKLTDNASSAAERSRPLNFRENYRLGLTLTWPLLTVYGVALLAAFRTGMSQAAMFLVLGACALAALAVLPWTIRRAIQTDFPDFHFALQRFESDDLSRSMTYMERLWLSAGLAGQQILILWLLINQIRSVPASGPGAEDIVLGGIFAVAFLGGVPAMVARVLLIHHSNKYRLQIVRKDSAERDET